MFSFIRSCRGKKALAASLAVAMMLTVAGCAKKEQAPAQATLVKTMQVIKRDTPIVYDYTGFVQAQQEMELKAQVSGQITGKFFKGGDTVVAECPLEKMFGYTTVLRSATQGRGTFSMEFDHYAEKAGGLGF